jgi:hypothetical protein
MRCAAWQWLGGHFGMGTRAAGVAFTARATHSCEPARPAPLRRRGASSNPPSHALHKCLGPCGCALSSGSPGCMRVQQARLLKQAACNSREHARAPDRACVLPGLPLLACAAAMHALGFEGSAVCVCVCLRRQDVCAMRAPLCVCVCVCFTAQLPRGRAAACACMVPCAATCLCGCACLRLPLAPTTITAARCVAQQQAPGCRFAGCKDWDAVCAKISRGRRRWCGTERVCVCVCVRV